MTLKKSASQELYDYCMKEYNRSNPITKCFFNNFYKSINNIFEQYLSADDTIFEVGCGAGESSERISKMIHASNRYEVSDNNFRYIEMIKKYRKNLNVRCEDVYSLETKDNEYDWVVMLEVLEHLVNYEIAVEELLRVSCKYLLLSVPREPFWRILNFLRLKYLTDFGNTPGHINHWTSKQLIDLLNKFGTVVCVEKPIPWTIILLKKRLVQASD